MSLYTPIITITEIKNPKFDIESKIDVAAGEGLKLISNTPPPAGGAERVIVYQIIAGSGGTQVENVVVNRTASEKKVTVKVEDKDGKPKGEATQEYE